MRPEILIFKNRIEVNPLTDNEIYMERLANIFINLIKVMLLPDNFCYQRMTCDQKEMDEFLGRQRNQKIFVIPITTNSFYLFSKSAFENGEHIKKSGVLNELKRIFGGFNAGRYPGLLAYAYRKDSLSQRELDFLKTQWAELAIKETQEKMRRYKDIPQNEPAQLAKHIKAQLLKDLERNGFVLTKEAQEYITDNFREIKKTMTDKSIRLDEVRLKSGELRDASKWNSDGSIPPPSLPVKEVKQVEF